MKRNLYDLGTIWGRFGNDLGAIWERFYMIWERFGSNLGTIWERFYMIWEQLKIVCEFLVVTAYPVVTFELLFYLWEYSAIKFSEPEQGEEKLVTEYSHLYYLAALDLCKKT